MKLINKKTGKEVYIGSAVETFRGEKAIVDSVEEPRHSGSTGRVYVTLDNTKYSRGFFPGVIGAIWQ